MDLRKGLTKIVGVFDQEKIPYMIVGGFAMSYYNRFRFTADIDCVLQIYPNHIEKIVRHFPDWLPFLDAFVASAQRGALFNFTDFETGIKYDMMLYQDSDYNWTAFERRRKVDFLDIPCFIAAPEDLIISKLRWYALSQSARQMEDIKFLLQEPTLDRAYLNRWVQQLNVSRYGLF
ncbi:MAG: hypothetical protein JNK89_03195 [Saprospiraceae bacterium]|nr:hypothetical protein [Saprospiraceae bacterium]